MANGEWVWATVMEDATLSLAQLSHVCNVEPAWVLRHVDDGLLVAVRQDAEGWVFSYEAVTRVRRILRVERDFDAVPELAALVADLQEELDGLRYQLRQLSGC